MHGAPAALQAETHEVYKNVQKLCETYVSQASALFQTYMDLKYAARWRELDARAIQRPTGSTDAAPFGAAGWAVIVGMAPGAKSKQVVVPMVLEQAIDSAMYVRHTDRRLSDLFAQLPSDATHTHVLLAMMSNDATVVYYRLSQGMVKPIN